MLHTFCCPSVDNARHAGAFANDWVAAGRLHARHSMLPEDLADVRMEAMAEISDLGKLHEANAIDVWYAGEVELFHIQESGYCGEL